ncbi:Os09g0342751 [Oryza sativa Japonica Group]|uniref:Os09g0342751 protein n=1 Tax=Oryza sativa subsp. japonica TaxID=39947 RepID=A0A0P0XKW3_ORYSJ|nr:Os09g0342751 [Oryza sativa Japonica Group]
MELAAAAVLTARGAANRVGVAIDVKGGTCTVAAAAFLLISRLPSVVRSPAHPRVPCRGGDGGIFPTRSPVRGRGWGEKSGSGCGGVPAQPAPDPPR